MGMSMCVELSAIDGELLFAVFAAVGSPLLQHSLGREKTLQLCLMSHSFTGKLHILVENKQM